MIKRIVPFALLGAFVLTLNACKSDGGFQKTEHGIQYKIVKDEKGPTANIGDYVEMHMKAVYKGDDGKDSTLFDSRQMNNNKPMEVPLPAPAYKGDFVEALTKLSAGDSAIIRMSVDSLKKQSGGQIPEFMKSGHFIEYNVTMVAVKSQQQMQQEQEKHATEQKTKDEQILQDYFTKNNLHPSKTPEGVYYIIEKEGTGPTPQPGQAVTVKYTGSTLDGKIFDSNVDPAMGHAEPFTFEVGRGAVIQGWDIGVSVLKKGTKAKLFIPSGMAYGQQSPSPAIPQDAILAFDIEVLKIENAPQAQQPQMGGGQPPVQ
ncbi:MAG TPA: FKBP-type peptidyl-prolyl cis-trans isomerase [Flavipsychrobacter sp.]|nr:FKBP-type peptidyl-prolyl cis-trans isomerase [Flavipsychrobacter sp.]